MTWILKHSWPCFDFRMQAAVGAASSSLALSREGTYVQLDFEQNDFPWTWKKGKDEEILVHSQCTFIASLAAACFYDSPSLVTGNWSSPELWREFHVEGSALHSCYIKTCILTQPNLALLGEFHCTPVEYSAHFDALMTKDRETFTKLRALFGQRTLVTLTDTCPVCCQGGHDVALTGEAKCATCHVQVPSSEANMDS